MGFGGYADFEQAQFNLTADFKDAHFGGNADFDQTQFNLTADFRDAHFGGNADFDQIQFNQTAYFEGALFNDSTSFEGSQFYSTTNFNETQFDKDAYFSDAQFNSTADFTSCWFKGDALFENTTFRGELSLTRTRYDNLFIRWHNINGGLAYDDTAYFSLLKNFKELGYFEDYDSCYFEYRKERRNQNWPLVGKWEQAFRKKIDLSLEWFYGYGTKPLNALFFSLGIISVFGAFWRLIGLGKAEEAVDEYSLPDDEHDGILEILAFSATVFLSGTRLFIEPPPLPKIGGRSRSLIRGAFIFERILGALFSILFFLAISGTVVRQL